MISVADGAVTSGTSAVVPSGLLTAAASVVPAKAYCTRPGGNGASIHVCAAVRWRGASAVSIPVPLSSA